MSYLLGAGLIAIGLWWALGWFGSDQAERNMASEIAVTPPPPAGAPGASASSAAAAPPSPAQPSQARQGENSAGAAPTPAAQAALLANEQAEAQRFAALKEKAEEAPPKSQAEPKLYYRVEVRDGGTLVIGDSVVKLAGVLPREADATCKDKNGRTWPCGAAARTALARLIQARAVTCLQPPGERKTFVAHCKVGTTDLSTWIVRQGWAEPAQPAEAALADAAEAARQDGLGIWRAAE